MVVNVVLDTGAYMPEKAHDTDAGFDIRTPTRVVVPAMSQYETGFALIDTGVHIEIPRGYVGMLKSKSGLNVNYGLTGEGVIDSGYTGSIVAKLYNHTSKPYVFQHGDKIIQLVIIPIPDVELNNVDKLVISERGDNGFGSTGK